jgi:hypothetical protein
MRIFDSRTERSTKLTLRIVGAVSGGVAAFLGIVVLVLGVGGASADQGGSHDLAGTVVVPFGVSSDPVSCHLSLNRALAVLGQETSAPCPAGPLGDWSDVAEGTDVWVQDGSGRLLGHARLTDGVADGGTVTFAFEVDDVPEADAYRFTVNTRGPVTYPLAQVVRSGWEAEIDLR